MALENSAITQVTQLFKEVTAGTGGAALTRLTSMDIMLGKQIVFDRFRPSGYKFATLVSPQKKWTALKVSGQPSYRELQFLLDSILKKVTPTTPGGGTNSRLRTYSVNSTEEETIQTYTFQQGNRVKAKEASYGLFTGLTIDWDTEKVSLSGEGFARNLTTGTQLSTNEIQTITVTGTPTGGTTIITVTDPDTAEAITVTLPFDATSSSAQTLFDTAIGTGNSLVTGGPFPGTALTVEFRGRYGHRDIALMTDNNGATLTGGTTPNSTEATTTPGVAATELVGLPILSTQIQVTMDSASGSLGTTPLARLFKGSFSITGMFNPVWVVNSANTSFVAHVQAEPKCELSFTVGYDSQADTLLAAADAGTTYFFRVECIGSLIEGALFNHLYADFAAKINQVGDFVDEGGSYAIPFTLEMVHDPTWGKAMNVALQNDVTA
jgi:hypothetical protein